MSPERDLCLCQLLNPLFPDPTLSVLSPLHSLWMETGIQPMQMKHFEQAHLWIMYCQRHVSVSLECNAFWHRAHTSWITSHTLHHSSTVLRDSLTAPSKGLGFAAQVVKLACLSLKPPGETETHCGESGRYGWSPSEAAAAWLSRWSCRREPSVLWHISA